MRRANTPSLSLIIAWILLKITYVGTAAASAHKRAKMTSSSILKQVNTQDIVKTTEITGREEEVLGRC